MKEKLKPYKIAIIIGAIILVIGLIIGVTLAIKSNQGNEPDKEGGTQIEQNQQDNNKPPVEEDDDEENSGDIIVEDTTEDDPKDESPEEDEKDKSFQVGEDEEMEDVLTELVQNNEGITLLTKEEIDQINNDIFFDENACYYPNMILSTFFSCPEEIDLGILFYMGLSWEEEREYASAEEQAKIEEILGRDTWGDGIRMPAEKVEQVLNKYTGLSISDYQEQMDKEFVYLEEYDCYYQFCSDVHYIPHAIEDGYRTSTGELVLLYRGSAYEGVTSSIEWINKAVVKETEDGGLRFISNERYGVTTVKDIPAAISDWENYEYVGKVDRYENNIKKVVIQTYTLAASDRPYFAATSIADRMEFELAEDCEIILSVEFDPVYLNLEAMELLQDKDCFKDKLFFICVEDGKIVKMIEDIVLRLNAE